jgi:hypothetical protein
MEKTRGQKSRATVPLHIDCLLYSLQTYNGELLNEFYIVYCIEKKKPRQTFNAM